VQTGVQGFDGQNNILGREETHGPPANGSRQLRSMEKIHEIVLAPVFVTHL
jgi:hypothetical protein